MTDAGTTGLTARFPRLAKRGVLLGLTMPQLLVAGVAVMLVAFALFTAQMTGLMVVSPIVVLCAAVAFVPVRGRAIIEWLPIVAAKEWKTATDQRQFRARPHRPEKPTEVGRLALPGSAGRLRVLVNQDDHALVYDAADRTLTAVVRVVSPAFVLLDSDRQRQHVAGWGQALARACHSNRVSRVQVLERTIPDSGDALATWWREHGSGESDWASAVYGDLLESAGPASERHETYVSMSLSLRKAVRQVRQHGGGLRGAAQLMAMEQRALVQGLIAAGLSIDGWLGPRTLAGLVRVAYDSDAAVPLDRRAHLDPKAAGVAVEAAGPVAVDEEWDHLRSDSGFHAVYWIAEWPRIEAHASFLHPLLFQPGVRRSLSIVYEPVPIDEALRQIRAEKVNHAVDQAQRERMGQLTSEAQLQERADVVKRERELVAGHGDVRFAGFIAVSAPSEEALEDACGVIETAATQALVDLRRLVGQQAEAFTAAALPFGRGLR